MNSKSLGERSLLIVCIVLGIVQAWIVRYSMSGDGMSYLDIGDAYFRGDWANAINGYWSPMYCWWMGLALNLLKPGIWWEFITVHAVNLVIYFVVLFCFRFFLHSVLRALREEMAKSADDSLPLPEWVFSGLGYGIFLWSSLELVDAGAVTPDLLVEAFVLLIGGYLVELRDHETYPKFAMFGILCGLAYLAKAFMFPMGFVSLAILFFSGKRSQRRVWGVLLATLLFVLVSLPFIAALSKQKGRFTFGDSGKIAYAGMVSPGVPPVHWQGEEAGGGVPSHATRQILAKPPIFEFAEPIGGTYPPWYDPSYWNEGTHGTFRLRAQIRVLAQSMRNYTHMLLDELGLLTGIGIFILWGGAPTRRAIMSNWPLIAVALVSMGLYAVVLVRTRYVSASMALLFVAMLAGIRLPRNVQTSPLTKYVAIAVMGSTLFSVATYLAETAYVTNTVYSSPVQKEHIKAAEGLRAMGLRAGDWVAVIGEGRDDYWARLGRFKIVAEVLSPDVARMQFWTEPLERRKLAYECLRNSGAKLVVVWDPPSAMDSGWTRVANTNYYAYFLAK